MNPKKIALRRSRFLVASAAALALSTLAACGGGSDAESSDGVTSVKVGVFAAADTVPLYDGIDKGYFEDQGLDVEVQVMDSGAAVAAAVLAGDVDFGYSNTLSLVIAKSKKLPVTIVAPGVAAGTDADSANSAVLVAEDSDIEEPADLAGKKVAVNALGNILEVTLRNTLKKAGVDPEDVRLVEVPFPEMPAALADDRVDAAFMLEPFVTMSAENDGAREVAHPYEDVTPSFNAGVYFTSEQVLQRDEGLAAQFREGLATAVEDVNGDPSIAPAVVEKELKIAPEVAEAMTYPSYITEADLSHVEIFAELGREYGLLDGDVDIDALTAGLDR